jgi:hypothetical protein
MTTEPTCGMLLHHRRRHYQREMADSTRGPKAVKYKEEMKYKEWKYTVAKAELALQFS